MLTDERCRTSADGVYAVGDIVPGLQLAHLNAGIATGVTLYEVAISMATSSPRK